jgi:hypothetical protein
MTTLFETNGIAAYYTQGATIYDLAGQAKFYIGANSDSTVFACGDGKPAGWIAQGYFYKYDGSSPCYFGVD